ncbi:MAG: hypothetical protein J6O61_15455 [Butyrivibrio sp.]|uniref:hypothetical protein n=1 Tax=Butyrivibrio sp. TaxID=28121 RepID=UPI001B1E85D2|nr:hypothetical protein [Butyrivibrio sp.]MBO6242200.1 hypothetical protein [Butyrivibrio sp.]
MEAISTVDSTFDFIEYHYWFRNYVFDCYLEEKDNIKLSILHEVMMKNKKGMPYSIHHQESFLKLLKELAQSDNAENNTVKKLKTKILTGERETKKGTIPFIHDRYLFTKIIMVAIYLLAATISGTSISFNAGSDNKIIISSYNINAALSNLLFYVPLIIHNLKIKEVSLYL